MQKEVLERSNGNCEVCGASGKVSVMQVEPFQGIGADEYAALCDTCASQYAGTAEPNSSHWRCLNDAMWSEVPAVKVIAYRMLNRLKSEGWPQDLLDMFYADEEVMAWAKAGVRDENTPVHTDSNGVELQNGDTVVLIKDLDVKGANFTAKRGTAVRNIKLVHDNHEHIEGKVNGQGIVILTKYVKK